MRLFPLALLCLVALSGCYDNIQPLIREANLPATSLQRRAQLAEAPQWQVRCAVAANRHTTARILLRLAQDQDPRVRIAIVTNLSSPERIRRALAKDPDPRVRSVLARFEYVSPATLEILSHDPDADIRHEVAGNWNTAVSTHSTLAMTHLNRSPDVPPKSWKNAPLKRGEIRFT